MSRQISTEKAREYNQKYWAQDKSKIVRTNYKTSEKGIIVRVRSVLNYLYKISLETYLEMYNSCEGKCQICGRWCPSMVESRLTKKYRKKEVIVVDHDETVRGLLCNNHNTGIGDFDHDVELLTRAQLYLEGKIGFPKSLVTWEGIKSDKQWQRILRTVGVDKDSWIQRWQYQSGECAICFTFSEVLDTDHDHVTGQFRGLLCRRCNIALGKFNDDTTIIQKAKDYLNNYVMNKGSDV